MNALQVQPRNATESARRLEKTRLLSVSVGPKTVEHFTVADFPFLLRTGDVLVVNDAATFPSSLKGRRQATGEDIELRLVMNLTKDFSRMARWRAVLFGAGDWRTPTENRALPPTLNSSDVLDFGAGLTARILEVHHDVSSRLIDVELATTEASFWPSYYGAARPIQYSYLKDDLALWDQQTLFSGPPVAVEPPSASFPLTWANLFRLQSNGVDVLPLTHGTGISNTGDAEIDRRLPFPEPYRMEPSVQTRLLNAKSQSRRIIAVGTGTVRALEAWGGVANSGHWSWAENKLSQRSALRIVSGLLTGLHALGASHLDLLEAFAPRDLLQTAYTQASLRGYLWHEFGDICLLL